MRSLVQEAWNWLAQPGAECIPEFREEIQRRSCNGLKLIGWALVAVPLGMLFAVRAIVPGLPHSGPTYVLVLGIAGSGAAALGVRRIPALYSYCRLAGAIVIVVVSCCLTWAALLRAAERAELVYLVNGQLAVVLLIALIALPFKPIQFLSIGLAMEAFCISSQQLAVSSLGLLPADDGLRLNALFLTMLTILGTAVAANQYRQIRTTHETHQSELRARDEMRDTQCRMLLSDSAASMGRLAAALSHEMNNPLGVLRSNLDLLRKLPAEEGENSPPGRPSIARIKSDLYRNSERSIERLQETVRRMERFTNLDRAEVMPADLGHLIADVSDIVREGMGGRVRFDLELIDLPPVELRPQLISAAFSALLQNAAEASPPGEPVKVRMKRTRDTVLVEVQDRGPGMTPNELAQALEPTFRVKGKRMASCNWNLFGARQAIRQDGGEIEIRSTPGKGTVVVVRLRLDG